MKIIRVEACNDCPCFSISNDGYYVCLKDLKCRKIKARDNSKDCEVPEWCDLEDYQKEVKAVTYKAICPITNEVWELDEDLEKWGIRNGEGFSRYGKKYKVENGKVFVEFTYWVEAVKEA